MKFSVAVDEKGVANGILGVSRNVSKRMDIEKERRKLLRAVTQSPNSIVISDKEGNAEYVNPRFELLTGYKKGEVIGENLRILNSGKQSKSFYKNLWDTIIAGENWHGEFRNKKKNGELYWEKASISPLLNDDREITHFVAVKEDITEKKKILDDLITAKEKAEESNRLKTAFLNNMSHEIRTPLNGITGFIGILQDSEIDEEEKQEYFDIINKSSDRLIATVTDIMDISKIEAGLVKVSKTEVSINKFLKEQYNFFYHQAESKGLELNYKQNFSDSETRFVTDKPKLEGILTNLIRNAIKYTEQGEITFACSLKKEKDIEFLEFHVKDTGIGIPANRLDAVFNRFEQADIEDTRAFEGSGLGLAIAKSYVEMLGGKISVISKEGEGSTFTFSIPNTKQVDKQSDTNEIINKEPQIALNNLSVIIAEDDETSIMFFDAIFKNKFDKITYTKSGLETIEKFRKNPDTDIILMDIKMPDLNGYDATREIRKLNKDVIILAQTAYGTEGDKEKALEAGCDDYITKPIKKELLFEKIRMCLNKKSI
ncbi:ATP-binding protein [Carboxylicivirga sp. N1Y90]|uniref:PAS domain-containing hybrid sensor histidine kinase/response regulator n=1 Tax=Carboxylicivirga fragile TaxID=3417571 RepID=UPI003D359938|nr:response regulator [Marinilabiliaceae bacterium N1Y90]